MVVFVSGIIYFTIKENILYRNSNGGISNTIKIN